jgi:hypothetical protein
VKTKLTLAFTLTFLAGMALGLLVTARHHFVTPNGNVFRLNRITGEAEMLTAVGEWRTIMPHGTADRAAERAQRAQFLASLSDAELERLELEVLERERQSRQKK